LPRRPPDRIGAREPHELGRKQDHEYGDGGRPELPHRVIAEGDDHDDHRALQPVADEEADDLADGGAKKSHASAGRRMSWTAILEAA
jgi:hypothetical protein